jgi:hypothetical protein
MQKYLEHPTEEALERFLLHQSDQEELDLVETHVLACDACVARLEELETQISDIKVAAQEWQRDPRRERSREKRSWRSWFTIPTLSWAGACAALLLGIAAIPLFVPKDVKLTAYRDNQVSEVPEWRPVRVQLNAQDLPEGPVGAQLLTWNGSEVWSGTSAVRHDQVEVELPRLKRSGNYFLRLYALEPDHTRGDLLREFPFQVK